MAGRTWAGWALSCASSAWRGRKEGGSDRDVNRALHMMRGNGHEDACAVPRAVAGAAPGADASCLRGGPFYLDARLIEAEAGGGALQVQIVCTMAGVEALEADWRRLEEAGGRDIHAFQSFDWCHAWGATFLAGDGMQEPFVVVVRRGGRIVLLWPMMRCRLGPLLALSWLSDPFSQYGDVLSTLCGAALEEALDAAWARVQAEAKVDIVRLRHVRADATIAPWLERTFRRAAWADGAPWMDLRRFADEAAYERRYSRTQKRRRKKIEKRLEKACGGPVFFSLVAPEEGLKGQIAALIGAKRAWLAARGLYSRPLGNPRLEDFLCRLPAGGGGAGLRLVVSRMAAGGRDVSWELGFRYKGRHYGYVTAHDGALTHLSPGRLHMDFSQKRALGDGMAVFDLLVPVAAHKESWSSAVEPVCDHFRPLTLAGRILGQGYLLHLRPALRRLYQGAPEALRRRIRLPGG